MASYYSLLDVGEKTVVKLFVESELLGMLLSSCCAGHDVVGQSVAGQFHGFKLRSDAAKVPESREDRIYRD